MVHKWLEKIQEAWKQSSFSEDKTAGLFIPNRSLNMVVVALLLFGLSSFMLGYFWGHRAALERFVAKIEEESFADRINYALYTMNDRDQSEFETDEQEDSNGSGDEAEEDSSQPTQCEEKSSEEQEPAVPQKNSASVKEVKSEPVVISDHSFVAPLAGFGTLQSATAFVQKIKMLDHNAHVEEKISKTARGKKITWYQVMTGEFEKREDLEKLVQTIAAKEHLKDVRIIEKRKG